MCNPGISSVKTDAQLASDLRRHAQAVLSIKEGLESRGYTVNGFATPPAKIAVKKEISI